MAAQRHEISLRVLKNISRVSPPFELFYDEFKVTQRHNCFHALRDFLERSLRFWIIHE